MSGEHGIGIEKVEAMHMVFSESELLAQRHVKEVFDPRYLANPGKVLPEVSHREQDEQGGRFGGGRPGESGLARSARRSTVQGELVSA